MNLGIRDIGVFLVDSITEALWDNDLGPDELKRWTLRHKIMVRAGRVMEYERITEHDLDTWPDLMTVVNVVMCVTGVYSQYSYEENDETFRKIGRLSYGQWISENILK